LKSNLLLVLCQNSLWTHSGQETSIVTTLLALPATGHRDSALPVVPARKLRLLIALMSSPEELTAAEADDAPVVPHVALSGFGHFLADEAVEQVVVVVGVTRRSKLNLHFGLKRSQTSDMNQAPSEIFGGSL